MSATADIQTEVKYGVYSIPIMAVTTRVLDEEGKDEAVEDEEEKVESATISSNGDMDVQTSKNTDSSKDKETVVFVEKEGKAYVKKVKTGIQDNTYIEVVEGLEAEDMIIKAPYSAISKQLKDDISVEVVEEEELYKDDKKKK